ncbi:MAG: MerR family transcriptional regulator [Acetivibrionales bacterium]|jgi:DNA-binding transcriptional MerR regulator
MEILKDRYTITELSERLKVTDHALRYYEKEFNINIPKDERGRRYYTPDLANLMYQIKAMRNEGLEIKAIKKILQSENAIPEPPPVVLDDRQASLVASGKKGISHANYNEFKELLFEFSEQLTTSISKEVVSIRDDLSKELNRSKFEIGACVENSVRKLESKMDKHFDEVDRMIGMWREKNKPGILKRLFSR